jgi:hypothetical protein
LGTPMPTRIQLILEAQSELTNASRAVIKRLWLNP